MFLIWVRESRGGGGIVGRIASHQRNAGSSREGSGGMSRFCVTLTFAIRVRLLVKSSQSVGKGGGGRHVHNTHSHI